MDENLHKDNLEEFFKKSFEELDKQSAEDWDMPTEQVWVGIDKGITSANGAGLFSLSWTKLGVAAAIGVLLISTAILVNQNAHLSDQLNEQAAVIEELQETITEETVEENIAGNTDIIDEEIPESNTPDLIHNQSLSSRDYSKQSEKVRVSDERITATNTPVAIVAEETKEDENKSNKAESQSGEQIEMKETEVRIAALSTLNSLETKPLESIAINTDDVELKAFPSNSRRPKRFYLNVYASPNFTYRDFNMNRPFPGPGSIDIDAEKGSYSIEWGAKVGMELSRRWRIETGLSFYHVQHKSKVSKTFPYMMGNELPESQGELESVYALSVPSSYGSSEVDLSIYRPEGQNIPEGTLLDITLKNKQDVKFVSVPLLVTYQLSNGPIALGIKGGFAWNTLNKDDIISNVEADIEGLRTRIKERPGPPRQIKKNSVDYILGLEANYQINSQWSVEVEPTYRKAMKPVVDNDFFDTTPFAFGLNAGVNYHF
jgi:hypothetical protein